MTCSLDKPLAFAGQLFAQHTEPGHAGVGQQPYLHKQLASVAEQAVSACNNVMHLADWHDFHVHGLPANLSVLHCMCMLQHVAVIVRQPMHQLLLLRHGRR